MNNVYTLSYKITVTFVNARHYLGFISRFIKSVHSFDGINVLFIYLTMPHKRNLKKYYYFKIVGETLLTTVNGPQ